MNKIYVSGNYIIVEFFDGEISSFASVFSVYDESISKYTLNDTSTGGVLEIDFQDVGTWFNEFGTTSFTLETLRSFLETNSGEPTVGGGGGAVDSVNGNTGDVTLTSDNLPVDSSGFTGNLTIDDNTLQDVLDKFDSFEGVDNSKKEEYIYNSSTERVLPYLYESIGWGQATKLPRTNFVSLTDHNDETDAMVDILTWVKNDTAIEKAITCALMQGDFLTANRSNGTNLINTFNTWLSAIPNDTPILWCNGNHDLAEDDIQALADRPSNQVLRDGIHTPLYNRLPQTYKDAFTWGTPTDAMYYKCDVPDTDVRVIAMNQFEYPIVAGSNGRVLKYSATGQYENGSLTYGFNVYYSQDQIEFIINQLESVTASQTVILMTHISIGTESDTDGDKNALSNHNARLRDLIRAYNSHSVGSITFEAIDEISSYTVNYDFSTHNDTWSDILNIRGHEHNFDYDTLPENNGVGTTTSIQCMSTGNTSPYIGINGDSISNYGADILSIKESAKELYIVRYGSRNTIAETGDPIGTDKHGFNFITNPITL